MQTKVKLSPQYLILSPANPDQDEKPKRLKLKQFKQESVQHYTFSSNSKEINEVNELRTRPLEPETHETTALQSNFEKTKTNLENLVEPASDLSAQRRGILIENNEASIKEIKQRNDSTKSESKQDEEGSFLRSKTSDYPRPKAIKIKSSSPIKRVASDGQNLFRDRVVSHGNQDIVGYMYIPKHLLEKSGWNIFLQHSSSGLCQSDKQVGRNLMV